MSGEIINLRRARKEKARADRESSAAENRAAFGRTKAAKDKDRAAREQADRKLDGHRASRPTGTTDGSLEALDHHRRPSDERLPRGAILVRTRRDCRGTKSQRRGAHCRNRSPASALRQSLLGDQGLRPGALPTARLRQEETDPSARSDQQRLIRGHRQRNLEHRNALSAVATGAASASAAMEWNPCHRRARSEHRLPAPASGR